MNQSATSRHRSTAVTAAPKGYLTESPDFDAAELVMRIRSGEQSGLTDLYRLFAENVSRSISRSLGSQDLEDRVHDAFLAVVRSIQRGDLRDPDRLLAFIHGTIRRQVATVIVRLVRNRKQVADVAELEQVPAQIHSPEQRAARLERGQLMYEVLASLTPRERDILTRFYLDEQTQTQICQDMGLTETQFRLLKSRAKARFSDLGKKRAIRKNLLPLPVPVLQPLLNHAVRVQLAS